MTSIRVFLAFAILATLFIGGCGGSGDAPAPDASKVQPLPDAALKSDSGSSDSAK